MGSSKFVGQGQMCDIHKGPMGQGQKKGCKQRQVGSHQRQVASFLSANKDNRSLLTIPGRPKKISNQGNTFYYLSTRIITKLWGVYVSSATKF